MVILKAFFDWSLIIVYPLLLIYVIILGNALGRAIAFEDTEGIKAGIKLFLSLFIGAFAGVYYTLGILSC